MPNVESCELARLVILDPVPFNAETWMCARVSELAAQQGIRGLVAFADPVARYRRTAGGGVELIKPGHLEVVYMAGGWQYTGRGTARRVVVLPDATVLSARSIAKVTGGERGRDRVIRRLISLGAHPPKPDEPATWWLPVTLRQIGAVSLNHPGNHRYVRCIGRTRAERTRTMIAMPAQRFPKPRPQLELAGIAGHAAWPAPMPSP